MTILKARTAGTSRPLSELPSDSSISVAHSAPSSSSAVVDLDHVAGDSQSVASAAEREALIPAPSMQGVGSDARPTVASRTTMVLSLAPPAVPAVPVSKFASTACSCANGSSSLRRPSPACLEGELDLQVPQLRCSLVHDLDPAHLGREHQRAPPREPRAVVNVLHGYGRGHGRAR
eukprot:CAMPEP_0175280700 /NCGR_PEP_ID=MMETSP0093-20121207/50707_1 /TAXON_ID=311494 /ORGANISM="Alexandrium monilatum, Strain CCMP3105" /LENGTH=175 /DNA_ID=CAMNT_0016575791 /DNA_START=26 /DNA_END=549 /DNA_ORIENTATION=-